MSKCAECGEKDTHIARLEREVEELAVKNTLMMRKREVEEMFYLWDLRKEIDRDRFVELVKNLLKNQAVVKNMLISFPERPSPSEENRYNELADLAR